MKLAAPRFALTAPPALPVMSDQIAVAGIADRLQMLSRVTKNPLTFERIKTPTKWAFGPGSKIEVGDDFFAISGADDQAIFLLKRLVAATPGSLIRGVMESSYVELIDEIRKRH